jgi:hypothetical protein
MRVTYWDQDIGEKHSMQRIDNTQGSTIIFVFYMHNITAISDWHISAYRDRELRQAQRLFGDEASFAVADRFFGKHAQTQLNAFQSVGDLTYYTR